jgi:hypothetical protein
LASILAAALLIADLLFPRNQKLEDQYRVPPAGRVENRESLWPTVLSSG